MQSGLISRGAPRVSIPSEEGGRVREERIGAGWWRGEGGLGDGGVELGTGSFHPGVATRC